MASLACSVLRRDAFPHLARRAYTTANPVRPAVPLINVTERLRAVMGALEPAWEAAAVRNAWFAASAGGGPAAAAARVALVWSTTEPFALSEPLHAGHNRNITHINAEARQAWQFCCSPLAPFGLRPALIWFPCFLWMV